VARIADHVAYATQRERQQIAQIAREVPAESFVANEGLNAHLDALRAWAILSEQLPPMAPGDLGLPQRTWRLIDELVFSLLSEEKASDHPKTGEAGGMRQWLGHWRLGGTARPVSPDGG
jgi:hypothetical protein